MPDNRNNLQVRQPGIEGYDVSDKNGWPTPLNSPLNPLKMVVSNGSRGEQRDFKAMATSRQNDLSKPEGSGSVSRPGLAPLDVSIKKTVGNSL